MLSVCILVGGGVCEKAASVFLVNWVPSAFM